jgi:nucleotide-binding universal stress UspA family protein
MATIKKILAPTDLSELSKAGIGYALKLAQQLGAEVTAYHVVNFDELKEYGRELQRGGGPTATPARPADVVERYEIALAKFLGDNFADLLPSITVSESVELGRPEERIVQLAKKNQSDLIVMSTHGRTGLSHALVGSVTEKVVRTAPCPVLSIRPTGDEPAVRRSAARA